MSINPTRAQARLAKTKSEANAQNELLKKQLAEEIKKLETLSVGTPEHDAQQESIATAHNKILDAVAQFNARILAQEQALQTKETTYPTKLARHLRKCRKYGWADARLASGKK